jgi:hypothetical protein
MRKGKRDSTGLMTNPDELLFAEARRLVAKKCGKRYPPDCILLVDLQGDITSADDFDEYEPTIEVPDSQPFQGIYVVHDSPMSSGDDGSFDPGGLRVTDLLRRAGGEEASEG